MKITTTQWRSLVALVALVLAAAAPARVWAGQTGKCVKACKLTGFNPSVLVQLDEGQNKALPPCACVKSGGTVDFEVTWLDSTATNNQFNLTFKTPLPTESSSVTTVMTEGKITVSCTMEGDFPYGGSINRRKKGIDPHVVIGQHPPGFICPAAATAPQAR